MDSTNPSPSIPTEPTQITQTLPPNIPAPTSTPTSNSAQNPLDLIGTNTAESQCNPTSTNPASTTFVIPTVSPADWAHTQHTSNPSAKSISQPAMALCDPPKKRRGQPPKPPAPLPKILTALLKMTWAHTQHTSKPSAKSISQPAMALSDSDAQTEAPQNSDGITQNDDEEDTDTIKAKKKCWFTPESDGKSDIDLVAEWVMLTEEILALTQWFNDANKLRTATSEVNKDADVEFTTSKEELAVLKWNKRRVVKKYEEEEAGSLELRILRICPWYKELELVLRDQPSASPFASRDSLGAREKRLTSFSQVNDQLLSPTKCSSPDSWEETPPHHEADDNWPSSQEQAIASLPQASQSSKPSCSVTPSYPASKRIRSNKSELCAARSQETITSNFAKEMSHMMTTNQAAELVSKENIAISKMNVELRIARSKMVIDLIRGNVDPTTAEAVALRSLPDIQPGQSSRPDGDVSGTPSQSNTT
ncbi:hypothetical protein DFH28DRAFT_1130994 [Melampsora americana]|nr:hypothetical protein DFH28DRAFT_1130994 [Melampsora americana]